MPFPDHMSQRLDADAGLLDLLRAWEPEEQTAAGRHPMPAPPAGVRTRCRRRTW
ncbi:hypothetical protein [Streptomyces sp. NPDC085937]|uniref:hypothetical protein n=1 Tax=Streptomyces sp. NPDC085937 TaxID=3365742 RepID=UPI0037CFEC40